MVKALLAPLRTLKEEVQATDRLVVDAEVAMRSTTKSPLALAREALAVAQRSLPKYSHPNSPKDFTQHQHFAILAVRQFLGTDYRGMARLLAEWSDLREVLGLLRVPHYSTLCYAERRLLKGGSLPPSWAASSSVPASLS